MTEAIPDVEVAMTCGDTGAKWTVQFDLAAAKAFRARLDKAIASHEGEEPKRKRFSGGGGMLAVGERDKTHDPLIGDLGRMGNGE